MAFNPELDKISINELNEDLKRKINTNYESTEGLKEDFNAHVADIPHETDTDYKTSTAKHVISAERSYWNSLENTIMTYINKLVGNLDYESIAAGLADKVGLSKFKLLTGVDWEKRQDQTLSNLAFSGEYKDVHNAPETDEENNIKFAKNAKIAELATMAVNADNASVAELATFANAAEKAYDTYMINSCMTIVRDEAPTDEYVQQLLSNPELYDRVSTVIWIDSINYHMNLCLNFRSYTDLDRVWHRIN